MVAFKIESINAIVLALLSIDFQYSLLSFEVLNNIFIIKKD